jgi:hypothetical protein
VNSRTPLFSAAGEKDKTTTPIAKEDGVAYSFGTKDNNNTEQLSQSEFGKYFGYTEEDCRAVRVEKNVSSLTHKEEERRKYT